tara:strand:- start:295 stop:432 length:138 start_codon:yes stop_codon:yes gene_type:complete
VEGEVEEEEEEVETEDLGLVLHLLNHGRVREIDERDQRQLVKENQ